jgi:hypothetical protein
MRQLFSADQCNSISLGAIVCSPRKFHGIRQSEKTNVGTKAGASTQQIIDGLCAASSIPTLPVLTLNYHSSLCPQMNQQTVCAAIM